MVDLLPAHDAGCMNIECPYCRALHWINERIISSLMRRSEFESCCAHGKVDLPLLYVPPAELYNLFIKSSHQGKEFCKNIVQYNAVLAFTSLGVSVDHSILGCGLPVFRIHGKLRHLSGSLLPESGMAPTYSQLYISDPHIAYEDQVSCNDNLSLHTLALLQHRQN